MKEITAPCSRCGGSGRQSPASTLARTLTAISAEWRSSSEIFERLQKKESKIRRNTLGNRLARLVDDGLIERRHSQENEREYDYRRVSGAS